jgi:hypothetical protein
MPATGAAAPATHETEDEQARALQDALHTIQHKLDAFKRRRDDARHHDDDRHRDDARRGRPDGLTDEEWKAVRKMRGEQEAEEEGEATEEGEERDDVANHLAFVSRGCE